MQWLTTLETRKKVSTMRCVVHLGGAAYFALPTGFSQKVSGSTSNSCRLPSFLSFLLFSFFLSSFRPTLNKCCKLRRPCNRVATQTSSGQENRGRFVVKKERKKRTTGCLGQTKFTSRAWFPSARAQQLHQETCSRLLFWDSGHGVKGRSP